MRLPRVVHAELLLLPAVGAASQTATTLSPKSCALPDAEVIKVGDVLGLMSRGLFLSNPELVSLVQPLTGSQVAVLAQLRV